MELRLEGAEQVEDAQSPHHPRGFPYDPPRHLGLSGAPVHEEDRNLADPESLSPRLVIDLDLEGVSIRANPAQIERFQNLAPEAFESARQILEGMPVMIRL